MSQDQLVQGKYLNRETGFSEKLSRSNTEEIKKLLEVREKYLVQLKQEKEYNLKSVPEGCLRICKKGNKAQYYYRNDPKNFNGVYIAEKEMPFIRTLAQKDYDEKVLRAVEKELKIIHKYLPEFSKTSAEQIYEKLHPERRKLIAPIRETDEQYLKKWTEKSYKGKEFDDNITGFYTAREERVRSKSEVIIADTLNREGIPYKYECPIYLKEFGKIYPDFTVLNIKQRKEYYWEHLGMMDDGNYAEKAIQRIRMYEINGIFPGQKLILTYETKKYPLDQRQIMIMIQHYLKG